MSRPFGEAFNIWTALCPAHIIEGRMVPGFPIPMLAPIIIRFDRLTPVGIYRVDEAERSLLYEPLLEAPCATPSSPS